MYKEYERVLIKSSGKIGDIVDIITTSESSPLYTVEVIQEEKTGNMKEDIICCEEQEIEALKK